MKATRLKRILFLFELGMFLPVSGCSCGTSAPPPITTRVPKTILSDATGIEAPKPVGITLRLSGNSVAGTTRIGEIIECVAEVALPKEENPPNTVNLEILNTKGVIMKCALAHPESRTKDRATYMLQMPSPTKPGKYRLQAHSVDTLLIRSPTDPDKFTNKVTISKSKTIPVEVKP